MKVTSYAMDSFVESGQIKSGGDATERLRTDNGSRLAHSGVQFSGRMVGVPTDAELVATDAELVARCRTGDDGAWALLVERFARYVHAILVRAYRLCPDVAEETFHDVFARVYEQLPKLRDDAAFRPWLAQLTRRVAVDALRAGSNERPADSELIEDLDVAADDLIAELEQALTVRVAMAELPTACGDVLDRCFARDETYATIGAALGVPPGTIAGRISHCLGRLRRKLEAPSRAPAPAPAAR
jgi:RNA polymerase sigma-70 factor (ECF subfamily)